MDARAEAATVRTDGPGRQRQHEGGRHRSYWGRAVEKPGRYDAAQVFDRASHLGQSSGKSAPCPQLDAVIERSFKRAAWSTRRASRACGEEERLANGKASAEPSGAATNAARESVTTRRSQGPHDQPQHNDADTAGRARPMRRDATPEPGQRTQLLAAVGW